MSLPNLYSRRKRQSETSGKDVYRYDVIPPNLRVQVVQILRESIGEYGRQNIYGDLDRFPAANIYDFIVKTIRRDLGVFVLAASITGHASEELFQFMLDTLDIERFLDCCELCLKIIMTNHPGINVSQAEGAVAEFNARMQEAGIGYQFQGGDIIRVDSYILHTEVVVPTLRLISDPVFATVDEEYREAHASFRAGDHETCLVDCAKAFESTLKIIGAARNWPIDSNDNANKLIAGATAAGFMNTSLQAGFTALRAMLESGVPTVRNKQGGHGAGVTPRIVPKELAAFQLHQTGAAILFLIEHHRANP